MLHPTTTETTTCTFLRNTQHSIHFQTLFKHLFLVTGYRLSIWTAWAKVSTFDLNSYTPVMYPGSSSGSFGWGCNHCRFVYIQANSFQMADCFHDSISHSGYVWNLFQNRRESLHYFIALISVDMWLPIKNKNPSYFFSLSLLLLKIVWSFSVRHAQIRFGVVVNCI